MADDNRDGAESLALLLEVAGFAVRVACDGRDAVEQARRFHPDVIFMDVGMPLLDGWQATRAIRAEPWGEHILIFALSGYSAEADRRRSLDAGMDAHFVKPIDPALLESTLTAALAKRPPQ